MREDVAEATLRDLVDCGKAYRLERPDAFIDGGIFLELETRVREALEKGQEATPWMMGATSLALSRALGDAEPALLRILAVLSGRVALRRGLGTTRRRISSRG